jgi:hypothetical protein
VSGRREPGVQDRQWLCTPRWHLTHSSLASRDEVGIWAIPVWFGGVWAKRRHWWHRAGRCDVREIYRQGAAGCRHGAGEARVLNDDYIGTEHLLLGLIHEGDHLARTNQVNRTPS